MLENVGTPLKSLAAGQKDNDLLDAFSVSKSLFYSICSQANKICAINYATIPLVDLLGFFSLYCKDTYIDISLNKRQENRIKANQMMNKFKGRVR